MRDNQEVFNFVALALIKQGKPSLDPVIHICMYRSKDGCRCAAGWLIPDDMYNPNMERTIIGTVIDNFGLEDLKPHRRLIDSLQYAHDSVASIYNGTRGYEILPNWLENWKIRMREVAAQWNLDASVLD